MNRFFLPHIARMAGYVPGEQPRDGGFIKLNTNENPYPPSPRVKSALAEAINDRLRLYPDPLSTAFCQAVARLHGVHAGDGHGGQRVGRPFDDPHPRIRRARRPGRISFTELFALFDAGRTSGRPLGRRPLPERLEPRLERRGDSRREDFLARQPR